MKPSVNAAKATPSGSPPSASSGTPHTAARTARTASSPGFCGIDSATAAMPHCARAASTDAAMHPRCAHPPRGGERRPTRATSADVGQLQLRRRHRRRRQLGCLDHEVALQLGIDRQRPHREHGGRRVEQPARGERRRGHRERAPSARSRTAPSPTRAVRPANVRASAAAAASGKIRRCDIRPKLPSIGAVPARRRDRRAVTDAAQPPDDFTPDPDPVASMLAVLDLSQSGARTTEDIFTGVSQSMPLGRVYGGQVLAQSIVAAERTIPDGRLGALDARLLPASRRRVQGHHLRGRPHPRRPVVLHPAHAGVPGGRADLLDDRLVPGRGPGHRASGADAAGVPEPEDLPDLEDHLAGLHPMSKRLFTDRPVDLRHVPSPIYLAVEGERVPHQAVWMRTRRAIPDDPAHPPRRARLPERPDHPGVDPARARGRLGDAGAEGREPRPRDVVAPSRPRRRLDAVRAGVAERARRPGAGDRAHLLARRRRCWPASRRRSWCGCRREPIRREGCERAQRRCA